MLLIVDEKIIELFFERSEKAIDELDAKYGKVFHKTSYNILNNYLDAEECVNDAYLGTWNSIPPHRPSFLKLFLAKVTRNLAFTRWRKQSAAKRGGGETELVLEELAGCIPGREQIDDQLNEKELVRAIQEFLDTLAERDRAIFLHRYFFVEDADTISARYGMKRTTVNVILSRTRTKLKIYLTQEGYIL